MDPGSGRCFVRGVEPDRVGARRFKRGHVRQVVAYPPAGRRQLDRNPEHALTLARRIQAIRIGPTGLIGVKAALILATWQARDYRRGR